MKKLIAILPLFFFLFSACTKPCSENLMVNKVSDGLASAWLCQNPDALKPWVEKIASTVKLCQADALQKSEASKAPKGPAANLVCSFLVDGLQNVVSKIPPAEAKCDASKIGAGGAAVLEAACLKIPL